MSTICTICHTPNTAQNPCKDCRTLTHTTLTWLTTNLTDIETYRINRAYGGHKSGNGGARRSEAPTPLHETIYDLLYLDRDGNILETLNTWATCLNQPPAPRGRLARQAQLLRDNPHLWESSASPVYAKETNRLTNRLRSTIAIMDETRIHVGNCLNPDCAQPVYAAPDAKEACCQHCNNTWTTAMLRRATSQQLLASSEEGKPGELPAMLGQFGIDVNANTIRTWAYRGEIQQTTTPDGEPTGRYLLSDVYNRYLKTHK